MWFYPKQNLIFSNLTISKNISAPSNTSLLRGFELNGCVVYTGVTLQAAGGKAGFWIIDFLLCLCVLCVLLFVIVWKTLDRHDFLNMTDRRNTIVCIFDHNSPRVNAYHIHEWIHDTLQLEDELSMIQIDGPRRRVYIKFVTEMQMQRVLSKTNGAQDFKHDNAEISQVQVAIAGTGKRTICIANLPPEVQEFVIRNALGTYGEINEITEEQWTNRYRYKVYNGIRLVNMNLKQHLPSHMQIAEHIVLISYDGQPATCYGCNGTGHLYTHCANRKRTTQQAETLRTKTWAAITAHTHTHTHTPLDSDDRQQSSMIQKEEECDETASAKASTPQKEDEAITLDETMSEPRTEGETDDTVLSQQDGHTTDEGKKHDPTPLDSNLPTIPTTLHVATDAGVLKRDPNKQRREDRTYIQDAHCTHDEADL